MLLSHAKNNRSSPVREHAKLSLFYFFFFNLIIKFQRSLLQCVYRNEDRDFSCHFNEIKERDLLFVYSAKFFLVGVLNLLALGVGSLAQDVDNGLAECSKTEERQKDAVINVEWKVNKWN